MILARPEDIARYRAAGWWGDLTVHGLFAETAAANPDALALVDPSNRAEFAEGAPARLTWRAVAEKVERMAAALLDAGLRRDDVVCLQLPTTHEHIVAYLACMRLGLVTTAVPFQYREHEVSVRAGGGICAAAGGGIGPVGWRSRPEGPIPPSGRVRGGHRIERLRWSCKASPEPERTR